MRMSHPGKPRIPNSIAIVAGIILVLGSTILGNPMDSEQHHALDCQRPNCPVAADSGSDAENPDSSMVQNTLNVTSQQLNSQAERSKRAVRNQLLLLLPGR